LATPSSKLAVNCCSAVGVDSGGAPSVNAKSINSESIGRLCGCNCASFSAPANSRLSSDPRPKALFDETASGSTLLSWSKLKDVDAASEGAAGGAFEGGAD